MARLSRKGARAAKRKRLQSLLANFLQASEQAANIEQHPIVFPSVEMRDQMFALGADIDRLDAGFDSIAEMKHYLAELRDRDEEFTRVHGRPNQVADGKYS